MTEKRSWEQRAKIVATLGPASDHPEIIEAMIRAGVDVARLNFSHGTHGEHARRIGWVRAASERMGHAVAVLQDIQGPKMRIGPLYGGSVRLVEGAELTITTEQIMGSAERFSTTYLALAADVRPGDQLLLADGRITLSVLVVGKTEVRCRVERGGVVGEHQGINAPEVEISAPAVTAKDEDDIEFGLAQGVDYVALSFVRHAADVERAREFIRSRGHSVPVIAKIEKMEAIDHLDEVLAASDGVMVARGDLGVEVGPERVPALQKLIVHRANVSGIPVIVATQMLETMIQEREPTRAEASDVANAVWDGADGLMLSGETAVGKHPVAVVEAMARIIGAAEAAEGQIRRRPPAGSQADERTPLDMARGISQAARSLAEDLEVRVIVGLTRTGRTAQLLSRNRPPVPIVALTPDDRVGRQLALWWGVLPLPVRLPSIPKQCFPR
jgi:pyruvate kinase